MRWSPLTMGLGALIVTALSAKLFGDAGVESALLIVIIAGVFAGGAVLLLR